MTQFAWEKDSPRTAAVVRQWPLESFGAMTDLAVNLERENAALREALATKTRQYEELATEIMKRTEGHRKGKENG